MKNLSPEEFDIWKIAFATAAVKAQEELQSSNISPDGKIVATAVMAKGRADATVHSFRFIYGHPQNSPPQESTTQITEKCTACRRLMREGPYGEECSGCGRKENLCDCMQ